MKLIVQLADDAGVDEAEQIAEALMGLDAVETVTVDPSRENEDGPNERGNERGYGD